MRGVYTATIKISALSEIKTLILLGTPSTTCAEILSAWITNQSVETNEQLDGALTLLQTPDTDVGDGTAITPQKSENGDASWAGTCRGNFTTGNEPGSYESTHFDNKGPPGLSGYFYDPLPEERPIISPSRYVGLRLLTAPAAFDAICGIRWRAIGG